MKIGKIWGIELRFSNLLIPLFFIYFLLGIGVKAILVFAIILLHELAHVAAALYWGIPVRYIEIFPFGGIARLDNIHGASLLKEITLSLSGPFVNFFFGGIFWLITKSNFIGTEIISFLFQATIAIGFFNLIPVFPFDGGRIFQAILSRFTGFFFAARFVSILGQICALCFFVFGIWAIVKNPINFHWWFIAAYLFYINRREKKIAFLSYIRYLTKKEKEIEAEGFLPVVLLVSMSGVSLRKIIEKLIPHKYHLIYVLDKKGNTLGLVTEKTLISMALSGSMQITLGEIIRSEDNK